MTQAEREEVIAAGRTLRDGCRAAGIPLLVYVPILYEPVGDHGAFESSLLYINGIGPEEYDRFLDAVRNELMWRASTAAKANESPEETAYWADVRERGLAKRKKEKEQK